MPTVEGEGRENATQGRVQQGDQEEKEEKRPGDQGVSDQLRESGLAVDDRFKPRNEEGKEPGTPKTESEGDDPWGKASSRRRQGWDGRGEWWAHDAVGRRSIPKGVALRKECLAGKFIWPHDEFIARPFIWPPGIGLESPLLRRSKSDDSKSKSRSWFQANREMKLDGSKHMLRPGGRTATRGTEAMLGEVEVQRDVLAWHELVRVARSLEVHGCESVGAEIEEREPGDL